MNKKPALTKRMRQYYDAILSGNASAWFNRYPRCSYPEQPFLEGGGFLKGIDYGYRNEWAAYLCAIQWSSREDVDVKKLQGIVIRSKNVECIYEFSRDVPGANVKRLQNVVLEFGTPRQLRKFAEFIPGSYKDKLLATAIIREVLTI